MLRATGVLLLLVVVFLFSQNERGQTRYTISPESRREALRRLLELNLEVAEKEAGKR